MTWEKEGVNYWDNPDCPRDYLEQTLRNLIIEVEGAWIASDYLAALSDEALRWEIGFYEELADK